MMRPGRRADIQVVMYCSQRHAQGLTEKAMNYIPEDNFSAERVLCPRFSRSRKDEESHTFRVSEKYTFP